MKTIISILSIAIAPLAKAEGNKNFKIVCNKNNECDAVAYLSGKKVVILNEFDQNRTHFIWHGNDLLQVLSSCGSPCNYSVFVDFKNNLTTTPAYSLVSAVEADTRKVIYINDKSKLEAINLVTNKKLEFDINYCRELSIYTAFNDIKIRKNKAYITYCSNFDNSTRTKVTNLKILD